MSATTNIGSGSINEAQTAPVFKKSPSSTLKLSRYPEKGATILG